MSGGNIRDCEHGHLRRSCEVCDLESERDRLKAELEFEREQYAKVMFDADRWRMVVERIANSDIKDASRITLVQWAKEALK
jgi:hypothetical protein